MKPINHIKEGQAMYNALDTRKTKNTELRQLCEMNTHISIHLPMWAESINC